MISRYAMMIKENKGFGQPNALIIGGYTSALSNYNNYSLTVSSSGSFSGESYTSTTGRMGLAGCSYGFDKSIFSFGVGAASFIRIVNLVTNTGAVGSDTTYSGNSRRYSHTSSTYGFDKGIISFGYNSGIIYTLVSNTGVLGSDTVISAGVAWRDGLAGITYGGDKCVWAYGTTEGGFSNSTSVNTYNLISNTGNISSDSVGTGTARSYLSGCSYGKTKGCFAFGSTSGGYLNVSYYIKSTNLVSDNGTIASDVGFTSGGRAVCAASCYGSDKGIFYGGYQDSSSTSASYNFLSNTGVVGSDSITGYMLRQGPAGSGYGS